MQSHHDSYKRFPVGSRNNPRQTWVMYLWPYVDQSMLDNKNDFKKPFHDPPGTIYNTMNGLCGIRLTLYYCPLDNVGKDQDNTANTYPRARGNYVVNWGIAMYDTGPPTTGRAPFGHLGGSRSTPYLTKIAHLTDGTSNTLMMSEYLRAWSLD